MFRARRIHVMSGVLADEARRDEAAATLVRNLKRAEPVAAQVRGAAFASCAPGLGPQQASPVQLMRLLYLPPPARLDAASRAH